MRLLRINMCCRCNREQQDDPRIIDSRDARVDSPRVTASKAAKPTREHFV